MPVVSSFCASPLSSRDPTRRMSSSRRRQWSRDDERSRGHFDDERSRLERAFFHFSERVDRNSSVIAMHSPLYWFGKSWVSATLSDFFFFFFQMSLWG